ncbi:MAG: transcriptional regulator [Bacillota bacterium]|nr:transcriptional regulator [Bacillota bacterium]
MRSRTKPVIIFGLLLIIVIAGITIKTSLSKKTILPGQQVELVKDIDVAVRNSIKSRRTAYGPGELATEGHIILGTEESSGATKVYSIASYGAFGFENGIFTTVSGSGPIPTVITFSRNELGEYSLLDYKEPQDGAGYTESLKKMFPDKFRNQVLSADTYYPELTKQKEAQAAEYLKRIDRTAQVSAAHVPRKLANISVQASNKLFGELTKNNAFLNNCPYWMGSRERIENGARYIYETSQSKTENGFDLISFKKTKEDGTVVEEAKYQIVGDEPQLLK